MFLSQSHYEAAPLVYTPVSPDAFSLARIQSWSAWWRQFNITGGAWDFCGGKGVLYVGREKGGNEFDEEHLYWLILGNIFNIYM